jgi:hypothetical protein
MNCTSITRDLSHCSGNGNYCVQESGNGFCFCDSTWTSLGDWAIQPGLDCDIHKVTIIVLSIIDIIQASLYICVVVRHLFLHKNKSRKWLSTDPKDVFPIFFLLFGISDIVLSILRVNNVERNIVGIFIIIILIIIII